MKQTKQNILDAANRLIAKNGVKNTSLRDVAAECQVSLGTITYHFPSREELLFSIMKDRLETRDQLMEKCFSQTSKEEKIKLLTEYFRSVQNNVPFQELYNYLMYSSLPEDSVLHDKIVALFAQWRQGYTETVFLSKNATQEERKEYASFLQVFINGLALCASFNRKDFPYDSLVRNLVEFTEQFRIK